MNLNKYLAFISDNVMASIIGNPVLGLSHITKNNGDRYAFIINIHRLPNKFNARLIKSP